MSENRPKTTRRRFLLGAGGGALASACAFAVPALFAPRFAHGGVVVTNFNRQRSAPTETRIVREGGAWPMVAPDSLRLMEEAVARYEIIVRRGGWPKIPRTRIIVSGSKGKKVRILRRRLVMEGYLPPEAMKGKRYDKQVAEAVIRYQKNMGLRPHGQVDRATQRQLNISAAARLETLKANLPRVEEYIKALTRRYIVVNIPAAQLEAVENGRVYSRHNIIVGMPDRPSPSLTSRITELNFNPYWNAPLSIVIKDIIPKARKDPRMLERMNIKVYKGYGGPEVDISKIDWDTIDPKLYHFRQEPGEGNAMASVKINFPNKYAVYLHDTPTKQLFTEGARYFSSGCVRVDQVHILTNWILNGQDSWNQDRIESVVRSRQRVDVKVMDPPSLVIAYLTAWITGDGQVHFRDDIYNLDGTGFIAGQPAPVSPNKAG